jgi:hypothetical protein
MDMDVAEEKEDAKADVDAVVEHAAPADDAPPLSVHDLLARLRRCAHDESLTHARTHDEEGSRMAFGLLEAPSKHTVRFHLVGEDLMFHDQRSCAERLGVMKVTNTFCYAMYPVCLTVGNLISLTALPMGVCIIAGVWAPDDAAQQALFALWCLFFIPNTVWQFVYMLTYVHTGVLAALLKTEPLTMPRLLVSRLVYTVSCAVYYPTAWNIVALVRKRPG